MTDKQLKRYLERKRGIVNKSLPGFLPREGTCPPRLAEAMHYSLMAGGKRLRPILAIAAAEACGGTCRQVLPVACAIEFIHTYSLIHDDLPAMDDDDLRRGLPTSHKVFGEALAILAGDALLTRSFEILAESGTIKDSVRLKLIRELSAASGYAGMIGGQVQDIESEGKTVSRDTVMYIHAHKTGALIAASVSAGAIMAGAGRKMLENMTAYGTYLGGAFQIVDDVLDVKGNLSDLGKQPGADKRRGKATLPSIVGVEAAMEEAEKMCSGARRALVDFGSRGSVLEKIVDYVLIRRV